MMTERHEKDTSQYNLYQEFWVTIIKNATCSMFPTAFREKYSKNVTGTVPVMTDIGKKETKTEIRV